jgi:hypothetical protein
MDNQLRMLEMHIELDYIRQKIAVCEDKIAKAYPYRKIMTFTQDQAIIQVLKERRYELRKQLYKLLILEDSTLN